MARAIGTPVLVSSSGSQSPLERIYLGVGNHNEKWLQKLIHAHPGILPMAEIEPGFGTLIPAAMEVPCAHGRIDNLFVSPSGDIVFVETKLWRNGESRREVVAQALDYVAALTAMTFEEFQAVTAKGEQAPKRLYDLVKDNPEDFATDSGFDRGYISGLERGVRNPSVLVLERLARALEVDVSELFSIEQAREFAKARGSRTR